jgi:hypothetical protein
MSTLGKETLKLKRNTKKKHLWNACNILITFLWSAMATLMHRDFFFLKKGKIFRNFNEGCSTPASSHRVIAAYIDERRVYTYIYTGWWEIKLFRLSLTYLLLSPPMFFFRYSLLVKVVQHDFFFFSFRPVCCWQCFQMLRIISTPPRPYFPTKNKRKGKKEKKADRPKVCLHTIYSLTLYTHKPTTTPPAQHLQRLRGRKIPGAYTMAKSMPG